MSIQSPHDNEGVFVQSRHPLIYCLGDIEHTILDNAIHQVLPITVMFQSSNMLVRTHIALSDDLQSLPVDVSENVASN